MGLGDRTAQGLRRIAPAGLTRNRTNGQPENSATHAGPCSRLRHTGAIVSVDVAEAGGIRESGGGDGSLTRGASGAERRRRVAGRRRRGRSDAGGLPHDLRVAVARRVSHAPHAGRRLRQCRVPLLEHHHVRRSHVDRDRNPAAHPRHDPQSLVGPRRAPRHHLQRRSRRHGGLVSATSSVECERAAHARDDPRRRTAGAEAGRTGGIAVAQAAQRHRSCRPRR